MGSLPRPEEAARRSNAGRPVARLSRTPGSPARAIAALIACAAVAGLAVVTYLRPGIELGGLVEEHGWLERSQPWIWVATGLVTSATCLRGGRPRRDLLIAGWMTLLCVIGGLRELDLHAAFNPENSALLGIAPEHAVHYRIDWWLGEDTAVLPRVLWAGAGALIASAVLLPFAFARIPWFWLLWKRDRAVLCLFVGAGLLVSGYVLDDFIERWINLEGGPGMIMEEGSEYLGQFGILFGAALLWRLGPSARAERLGWPGHFAHRSGRAGD